MVYTNENISISALLIFEENRELKIFFSNDRFETTDDKVYKNNVWETPIIGGYKEFKGYKVPTSAKLIY